MNERPSQAWCGIDAGKGHHWAAVVDETGATMWSKKIDNDETAILAALGEVLDLADEVRWAVDISGTASALLLALLAAHGQQAVYVPGRTVSRMAGAYRGEGKTDARDAYVIAETIRHRQDFAIIRVPAQLGADLALLTAHRSDLVADRVRMINRLRDVLSGAFPALERAFDYSAHKGALILLTGYQIPADIRRRGRARLTAWLANRGVRSADTVAAAALDAAQAQYTSLPGEAVAAQIVTELAVQILALDDRLKRVDRQIGEAFRTHPQAEIIESLPGMGPILGAEFVVAAGDLSAYADAGHLASAAGLVPVPRDSGRRTGNLHRPKRYSRRLRRTFYLSAQTSIIREGPSRDFYLKKRGEGCKHVQAVIALARRRVSVLWALLRDNRIFSPTPPVPQNNVGSSLSGAAPA
ncbi:MULTISPECIES: IS110 family transposase [Streptomyces]|uniref:IS110 family transposase n=4 Tax=Streptomyces TaxID=1883 RepID=A0ABW9IBR6_STRGJ|nr:MULTISPECIES: IS110 family transposase [Streptomyces]MBP5861466.1 IS110 family transposase [Streptomyces sp. LBUM 1484]MBP5869604.1 IS110 family transposase [Streptomyces sp. LBUM 1485]MBP5908015.1 IS110 family transposase [Streptomyces sp. LBUM 1478]MBP5929008.1 IS110 family transposase [Streptomyces sp. LBUM 1479]MBP5878101.1 IS110 family transposase [Streptomyces sp. LBUM 1477]